MPLRIPDGIWDRALAYRGEHPLTPSEYAELTATDIAWWLNGVKRKALGF